MEAHCLDSRFKPCSCHLPWRPDAGLQTSALFSINETDMIPSTSLGSDQDQELVHISSQKCWCYYDDNDEGEEEEKEGGGLLKEATDFCSGDTEKEWEVSHPVFMHCSFSAP